MDQDTEITQKPLSTTKEYTRGSLKSLIYPFFPFFHTTSDCTRYTTDIFLWWS